MKVSIQRSVILIVGLLFLAAAISIYSALGEAKITPLILVASANIVAVILLTFLITRGVVRPLNHIRSVMRQVGEGNLGKRIDMKATKEMEEVAETFNDMTWRLQSAKNEIEDTNKILEQRVKNRTKQLQDLTESLEQSVQKRTKEFKEKVEELERFQKLAVGRELRMVELKKQLRGEKNQEPQQKSQKKSKSKHHYDTSGSRAQQK